MLKARNRAFTDIKWGHRNQHYISVSYTMIRLKSHTHTQIYNLFFYL